LQFTVDLRDLLDGGVRGLHVGGDALFGLSAQILNRRRHRVQILRHGLRRLSYMPSNDVEDPGVP
jgi:hypothetical protein